MSWGSPPAGPGGHAEEEVSGHSEGVPVIRASARLSLGGGQVCSSSARALVPLGQARAGAPGRQDLCGSSQGGLTHQGHPANLHTISSRILAPTSFPPLFPECDSDHRASPSALICPRELALRHQGLHGSWPDLWLPWCMAASAPPLPGCPLQRAPSLHKLHRGLGESGS